MKFNKLLVIGFIILITLVNLGACAIFTIGSSGPSSITILASGISVTISTKCFLSVFIYLLNIIDIAFL